MSFPLSNRLKGLLAVSDTLLGQSSPSAQNSLGKKRIISNSVQHNLFCKEQMALKLQLSRSKEAKDLRVGTFHIRRPGQTPPLDISKAEIRIDIAEKEKNKQPPFSDGKIVKNRKGEEEGTTTNRITCKKFPFVTHLSLPPS